LFMFINGMNLIFKRKKETKAKNGQYIANTI